MYDELKNSETATASRGRGAKGKGLAGLQCRSLEREISEAGTQASVEEVLGGLMLVSLGVALRAVLQETRKLQTGFRRCMWKGPLLLE